MITVENVVFAVIAGGAAGVVTFAVLEVGAAVAAVYRRVRGVR